MAKAVGIIASLLLIALFAGCSGSPDDAPVAPPGDGNTPPTQGTNTDANHNPGPGPAAAPADGPGGKGNMTMPAPGTPTTWFLHHEKDCSHYEATMNLTDSSGDGDGCGDTAFTAAGETLATHASDGVMVPAYSKDTGIKGTVYIIFDVPSYVEVVFSLKSDGKEVARYQPGGAVAPGTLGYTEFPFEMKLTEAIAPHAQLSFDVEVFGPPDAFVGYEDDHASTFTIG